MTTTQLRGRARRHLHRWKFVFVNFQSFHQIWGWFMQILSISLYKRVNLLANWHADINTCLGGAIDKTLQTWKGGTSQATSRQILGFLPNRFWSTWNMIWSEEEGHGNGIGHFSFSWMIACGKQTYFGTRPIIARGSSRNLVISQSHTAEVLVLTGLV